MKLSPEQKQLKKDLSDITTSKNRCLSALSFKEIKTYEDFLVKVGYDRESLSIYYPKEQLSAPVTRQQIIDFHQVQEERIKWQSEYKPAPPNGSVPKSYEFEGVLYDGSKPDKHTIEVAKDLDKEEKQEEKLPHSEKQKCILFPFQERASIKLLNGIIIHKKRGQLLRAAVGTGKTYIIGAVARRLLDTGFCEGKTFSPWPMVYVTRASIVAQTERVLKEQFGIDIINELKVINIEQLRAAFGELMVRSETIIESGEEHIVWKWRKNVHPLIIFLDECQAVKNLDSQQSKIMQSFNDLNPPDAPETFQLFFSATPFMRVIEAKCFAVSTRVRHKYGVATAPLSNDHFKDYANHIAHTAEPEEYSPSAVERLMTNLNDYIVDVKGVRSQFNAHNSVQRIHFQSKEERAFYDNAWNRYLAQKAKIEGDSGLDKASQRMMILVQFLKFRQAAELCRAPHLAKSMWEAVNKHNQAAVCAVNFKPTIRKVVDILVNDYNVSRDDISLIWGGGKAKASKKQKQKGAMVSNSKLMELLKAEGLDLSTFNLDDVDEFVEEKENPELRLGVQSLKERQKEIDRFQSGKSLYCLFTFKAGGVGLSLHHTDEFTKEKCRRKKSGWVVEEDIPKIPTRQRVCFLAPTYSAIELVQGLGRCPRLTSLSDTPQTIIFYAGTIEDNVAAIVSLKLRCLRKVVRTRESWEDCIVGGVPASEHYDTKVPTEDFGDSDDDDEGDGMFLGDEDESDS